MKTRRLYCIMVLASFCWLILPGSPAAQGTYKFITGKKYPVPATMHMKHAISPEKWMNHETGQPGRMLKSENGEVTVHPDSLVSYSGYEGNTKKKIYNYDCQGNLLTLLVKTLLNDTWENFEKVTYTYDGRGRVLTMTDQGWDGQNWLDFYIFTYTYDGSGNQLTWLYEDVANGFTELISSSYDIDGNKISDLGQYWDGTGYVNLEYYTYTYYIDGDCQSMLWQFWDGSDWANYIRETWTYYAKNKWQTDFVEVWGDQFWSNYSLFANSYDAAGNLASYTGSYWDEGPDWTLVYGGFYTYDTRGNRLSDVERYWADWENPPFWIDTDSTAINYDYQAMEITGLGYVSDGSEWMPGETLIYIPFMENGTQLEFASEWPSHEVDVFYSPVVFTVEAGPDASIYIGYPPLTAQLKATGAVTYSWSPVTGLSDPNIADPIAAPSVTTTYMVTGTDHGGCTATDEVTVTVNDIRCGKKLDKVLVCLVPPGNPGKAHTVCVDPKAVETLLANGSYLGPCLIADSPKLYSSEDPGEFSLEASPNPVSDGFVVTLNTPLTESFEIKLFDCQGRMVQKIYSGELDAGEHRIAVKSIESPVKGMFFLNVLSPSQSVTLKLMKP